MANLLLAVMIAVVSLAGFRSPRLVGRFLFDSERILQHGEYERMLTSAFFHAGLGHLAFNLISLYSFGLGIERIYGSGTFLLVFFASVLGGSLFSFWLHRGEEYRALGASGGVCGVIYAAIFLLPGTSVYIFFIPYPVPASIYAVLFLGISIWGMQSRFGRIGHDAHVGGALVGLGVTTFLYPGIIQAQPLLYLAIVAISVGLIVWLRKKDGRPTHPV